MLLPTTQINLTFHFFDVEDFCVFDYVVILDSKAKGTTNEVDLSYFFFFFFFGGGSVWKVFLVLVTTGKSGLGVMIFSF